MIVEGIVEHAVSLAVLRSQISDGLLDCRREVFEVIGMMLGEVSPAVIGVGICPDFPTAQLSRQLTNFVWISIWIVAHTKRKWARIARQRSRRTFLLGRLCIDALRFYLVLSVDLSDQDPKSEKGDGCDSQKDESVHGDSSGEGTKLV